MGIAVPTPDVPWVDAVIANGQRMTRGTDAAAGGDVPTPAAPTTGHDAAADKAGHALRNPVAGRSGMCNAVPRPSAPAAGARCATAGADKAVQTCVPVPGCQSGGTVTVATPQLDGPAKAGAAAATPADRAWGAPSTATPAAALPATVLMGCRTPAGSAIVACPAPAPAVAARCAVGNGTGHAAAAERNTTAGRWGAAPVAAATRGALPAGAPDNGCGGAFGCMGAAKPSAADAAITACAGAWEAGAPIAAGWGCDGSSGPGAGAAVAAKGPAVDALRKASGAGAAACGADPGPPGPDGSGTDAVGLPIAAAPYDGCASRCACLCSTTRGGGTAVCGSAGAPTSMRDDAGLPREPGSAGRAGAVGAALCVITTVARGTSTEAVLRCQIVVRAPGLRKMRGSSVAVAGSAGPGGSDSSFTKAWCRAWTAMPSRITGNVAGACTMPGWVSRCHAL